MARLEWDKHNERIYESGVSHGVLFIQNDDQSYSNGVVWNGLTSVIEKRDGGDAIHVYSEDSPYNDIYELEILNATIKAYTYPDEFEECLGYRELSNGVFADGQDHKHFCLCYTTNIGDPENMYKGYKIHILYDCVVMPAEYEHSTINDSVDILEFSWNIETHLSELSYNKPSANIVIDSTKIDNHNLRRLESMLYGSITNDSTLIPIGEIEEFLKPMYLLVGNEEPVIFGETKILL